MHANSPCIIFCVTKIDVEILTFESIVIDCKMVEIPPKLITNDAAQTAKNLFERDDKDRHPFVISTIPSSMEEIGIGKSENKGEKHSITTKKIVIMQPTERIESVEFNTISLMSEGVEICCFESNFSLCLDL